MTEKRGASIVNQKNGKNLRRMRRLHGLSQQKLAKVLKVNFQQVQKYESGANRVSAESLFYVSEYVQCDMLCFFEGISLGDSAQHQASAPLCRAVCHEEVRPKA